MTTKQFESEKSAVKNKFKTGEERTAGCVNIAQNHENKVT